MTSHTTFPSLTLREKLIRLFLFIVATTITVYFLPREGKFRYHFQEGKPWRYGLLTASFDFPIYKTNEQIAFEHDSILQNFHPYFRLSEEIGNQQINKLQNDYQTQLKAILPVHDYHYLEESLRELYQNGMLNSSDQKKIEQDQVKAIRILENNTSKIKHLSTVRTVREAYEQILANVSSDESRRNLRNSSINNYLQPNLSYDTLTSQKIRAELLQTLTMSSGLVQAGERIVDRGEIITPHTYNILRSLEIVNAKRGGTAEEQTLTLIGQILISLLLLGSLMLFMMLYQPGMFHQLRDVEVTLMMVTGMVVLCALLSNFRVLSIYMVPFAMIPIVLCTFLDSRMAFFAQLIAVLLCCFLAPFTFEFFLLQVAVGITTIFSLKDLIQRSQLFKTAIYVLLTYCIVYVIYTLITEGSWSKINPMMFAYFGINAVFLLFTYLLIFILEKTLGFTSNVTLVELSNINSPLLRRLSEECPGTFQHSLQISNLCAQAARAIGANVQLIRTAALYHDIGKLNNPTFFTENQLEFNPHTKLTIEQSVEIIKRHVSDGIKLAQREKLPEAITAFIRTHHGTSKIKYFYNRWKNDFPDLKLDEQIFYYPGPNPETKEQALLMMADCVEAASRSLKDYNDESFTKLVNTLIDGQVNEGMFKNTTLSFRDVETVKEVFIERLRTMYHTRISYPELKNKNEK